MTTFLPILVNINSTAPHLTGRTVEPEFLVAFRPGTFRPGSAVRVTSQDLGGNAKILRQ